MSDQAGTVNMSTTLIEHLPFEVDAGVAERANIGLIVLATDYTIEYEWRIIFSNLAGVALYHSRIENEDVVTPDSLRAMAPRIVSATALFTPGTPLQVVAYGCTSASMTIGEDKVINSILQVQPDALCSTPITAAFAAFKAFSANKIGILTPYQASVNQIVVDYIKKKGVDVPVFASFNELRDSIVARISPESIEAGVREILKQGEVDMIFVSCTSVRLIESCRKLEKSIGIPLTSSNHAMAWHSLRLAGISDELPQFGRLFSKQLSG